MTHVVNIDILTGHKEKEKFNFESWKEKPEVTPKGSSYYLHDERARDDMNYWERKQYFLATGKLPTTRSPPARGRGSFRGRGAPRPPRGRGSPRGYVPAFVRNREATRELEWKHDKFTEIDKETGKDTENETHKSEGKVKHLKKNVKDKDDSDNKKKVKKDKSKENKDRKSKDNKERENKDSKDKGSKDKKERERRNSKKNKEKETGSKESKETQEKEKSKSNGAAGAEDNDLDEGNVGPNFSNLLTLT